MKVKATQLGYYGHRRRRAGQVFDIKGEKEFSKLWMEKVGESKKGKSKGEESKDEDPSEDVEKSPSDNDDVI